MQVIKSAGLGMTFYTKLLNCMYQVELWTLGGDMRHKVCLLMYTLSFIRNSLQEREWSFLLVPKKTHGKHNVQLKSAIILFSYTIPWEVTIATSVFWPGTYSTLGSCFCVKKPSCFVCILSPFLWYLIPPLQSLSQRLNSSSLVPRPPPLYSRGAAEGY